MHHPADDIPWHLVASNLHWAPGQLAPQIRDLNLPELPGKLKAENGCACGVTNLHSSSPAPQTADQDEFARAFAQVVSDSSKRKRSQYPEKYDPPKPSDPLLGDELFEKVDSLLSEEVKGGPKLPLEQRTASAFLHPWECDDHCNFTSDTEIGFLNLEVVKMLLMLGELDPILRACAHPDEGLSGWYSAALCDCMASTFDIGWDIALFRALRAYITLNFALCFPEICDPTAGRTDETDYRHTEFYQRMLREITEEVVPSEATVYPHLKFFGIPPDHFRHHFDRNEAIDKNHWLHRTDIIKCGPYGILSFDEFLNLEGALTDQYQPLESEVETVEQDLYSQGLPMEIVLIIMNFADYKTKGVLKIPNDPLHPANRAELSQYLDQCWQIIIGCEIMNEAFGGDKIEWQNFVHSEVKTLFHRPDKPYGNIGSITGLKCSGI